MMRRYIREIERLKVGYYYCPKCFKNNLSNKSGHFYLFDGYFCYFCNSSFLQKNALTKQDIREVKIDKILYDK